MKNEALYKLGKTISRIRESKGITQEKLEELSGLSTNSISKIENGETNPRYTTLLAFAQGLDIQPYQLLAQAEYEPIIKYPELKKLVELLNGQDIATIKFVLAQTESLLTLKKKS